MILALAAICAIAYVALRWGVRRFQDSTALRAAGMRVVDRLGLEPRRSLYVVEVGGRYFLVGSSEGGLRLISEIDADTAVEVERRRPTGGKLSFRQVLLGKRKSAQPPGA
jgi:flagellar protein FliO/FliZ